MENKEIIIRNLKFLRNQHGYTQAYVANEIGIAPNYYSEIENGHRHLQLKHLSKIKKLYKVNVDDFLFDSEIAKCENGKTA